MGPMQNQNNQNNDGCGEFKPQVALLFFCNFVDFLTWLAPVQLWVFADGPIPAFHESEPGSNCHFFFVLKKRPNQMTKPLV